MKKYLLGIGALVLAFAVLVISVFKSASVTYAVSTPSPKEVVLGVSTPEINYPLPFPGSILPDSPLWIFKAARDQLWFLVTTNPLKKAELALLFSDKRLQSAQILLKDGKPDIALSTLAKGEKYMEVAANEEMIARKRGMDTGSFLIKLATAALKHREVIEQQIVPISPDDAKPAVQKMEDYSKNIYKYSRDLLNAKGIPLPNDPFSGS